MAIRAPAHACLQSTHHPVGVLRKVGYSGVVSAAQRLSPTSPWSGQATTNPWLRSESPACHSGAAFESRGPREWTFAALQRYVLQSFHLYILLEL